MLQNATYVFKRNDLNLRTSNLGFLCPMIRYEVWPHTWEGITFHPCCSLLFCRSLPRAPFISQEPLWKRTVSSTEWKPLKTKCKFPVLAIYWWLYLTIRLFNTTFALHATFFFIDAPWYIWNPLCSKILVKFWKFLIPRCSKDVKADNGSTFTQVELKDHFNFSFLARGVERERKSFNSNFTIRFRSIQFLFYDRNVSIIHG